MRSYLIIALLFVLSSGLKAQHRFGDLRKDSLTNGIIITYDEPENLDTKRPTRLIVYALPNGNTTAQTFGKKLAPGDDWHFDIQHIGAQTTFIRLTDIHTNYIVVYLGNNLKSWPAWRRTTAGGDKVIGEIIEKLQHTYRIYQPKITLSGHSGGGSFIFGYLNSQTDIPAYINRIGFLDATYGYETEKHLKKLEDWLKIKNNALQVIAYNDSVVIYNGKPLVSPTGGTWYRSQLMARDLQTNFKLKYNNLPDRLTWHNKKQNIAFSLIKNPEGKIYHTVLVEKNGFIALVFNGTQWENKKYQFWGERAYTPYILP